MRDNDFEHLNNQEDDDIQATQAIARRTTQLGDNAVADSGIIESVTCYNFMCHERLHVELGPLLNFIVGENGSGKSAVLTALTLCLGGKASDTNRGGSLKSFVKEGQEHGSLVVKVKNRGSDAYQPDLYGESIIIERHFSKTGSSGFKIKSAMGKIISNKKQEVDEISEWFALQIGNPLTVLSQDNARQFLNSASPSQKYKYFITGVQLEQLDNDYKMSQDTLDKTLIVRDDLNENIVAVKKEMEEAERLAKTVEGNTQLRDKIAYYRYQLAWVQVVRKENEHAELARALEQTEQNIAELESKTRDMQQSLEELNRKFEEAQQDRASLEEDAQSRKKTMADTKTASDDQKAEVQSIHNEEREAKVKFDQTKRDITKTEEEIKREEQLLEESSGAERAAKDTELNDAKTRERDVQDRYDEAKQREPTLQAKESELSARYQEISKSRERKRQETVTGGKQLEDLRSNAGGPLDGYLPEIKRLVSSIQKEASSFSQKPLGPLGAHVRLLKPEWASILEKFFGDGLNAFIVRSKSDQSKLSDLMRRCGLRKPPPIFIAYGGAVDTSSQEPGQDFDTILRSLEIDNEIVASQLVINYTIEKIVLIKERTEAERLMGDAGVPPPRNVSATISFHDGQGKRGHGLQMTNRNGTVSTKPIFAWQGALRMRSDSAEQIRLQEEQNKQLGTELRALIAEERLAKQAATTAGTDISQNRSLVKTLANELRQAQAEVARVEEELDSFEGVDDRLNEKRTQLEEQKSELQSIVNQATALRDAKRKALDVQKELLVAYNAAREDNEEFENRTSKADAEILRVADLRTIALRQTNESFAELDQLKISRNSAERRRDDAAAVVEQWTNDARAVAPERVTIPEGETMDSIKAKWGKLKQQLDQRSKRLGATDEEIFLRARETRKRYTDVHQQAKDVDETIKELKQALEHRLHLWRQFQRQISARIRIQFSYLLSERAFRGKIVLDHRARKVHLNVEPDETRASAAGRDTKTLSGGEKSFSSICMLLSVWEAIGSPIRCLDEFDVFMDSVNRTMSTRMLVSHICLALLPRI